MEWAACGTTDRPDLAQKLWPTNYHIKRKTGAGEGTVQSSVLLLTSDLTAARSTDLAKSSNYLVDPASSHMLVSKIKPCMCQYTPYLRQNREWLIKSVMIH